MPTASQSPAPPLPSPGSQDPSWSARLALFAEERDRRLMESPQKLKANARTLVRHSEEGLCAHCGEQIATTVERLVPTSSGGSVHASNLIRSCRSCHKRRLQWDVLELAQLDGRALPPALAAQRMDALALCPQHPVPPAARRTLDECRAYLSTTRWVHPRVPFLVSTSGDRLLLAALQVPLGEAGASLLAVVREAGGRSDGNGVWSIGRADWSAVVWKLIDRHAILQFISSDAEQRSAAAPNAPWRERWHVLFDDLADARRDAPRKPHRGFRVGARSRAWMANQGRRA